jgi:hypothetical protein
MRFFLTAVRLFSIARRVRPPWAMAALAFAYCNATLAAAALDGRPGDHEILDASKSASLAGVVHDQDATPADLTADATYRLPGFIERETTLDNLRRRFGPSNVTIETLDGAEGETSKGIVLFAGDAARRAELFVQDEEHLRGIASIRVSGKKSRWHFDSGVHPGLSLSALVALNGQPVTFTGLDWDYGGSIGDWHKGHLAQRAADPAFQSVALTHDDTASARSYPTGEGNYRSDDTRYPKQGTILYVGQIMVSFPDADND